ncbi:MAG TPA: tryptophan 7-halogenase [Vicinamibacterales bacterium]|jgi:FADH2 O2-dependent halogenase|nr:tryptophan 7-halogenase [Vicinamibacterales bacterium]
MDVDLAIVGSGFGGSILAMVARRLGLRVALLERGRHPRFAIGESSSPLAGILLEQLADRYDLPRLKPLATFGAWQRAYPDVGCGLKRGFTYFKHDAGRRFVAAADRSNQLLVAASPNDELSDTHWLRADVDAFLMREAVALGAEYADDVELAAVEWSAAGTPTVTGHRRGATLQVRARGVVDASGPRGFLSRALAIEARSFDGYPGTQALFSHFTDVERCDEMADYAGAGARGEYPPYPVDDAALHHVFDGGWMWVLRFGNGVTSAGVAVVDALAEDLRVADGEPAWHRLLERFPTVRAQFADARATRRFDWMPRLGYRAASAAGPRWALLPSAAAFVDPLFSTGFPLTLLGIERLASVLDSGAFFDESASLEAYGATTLAEADHTARFVAGCYAGFPRFDTFVQYSMFYFAAASYAEMARRVAPARAAAGFLRAGDPEFALALRALSPAVSAGDARPLADGVRRAVEPVNMAGLCEPAKRNWYGADAADAIAGASKLGVAPAKVAAELAALGF